MPLDTDKIKALREKLGWSMQDAAEKAGLRSRQHWHGIESGSTNVTLSTLEAVASALGVRAKDLLK